MTSALMQFLAYFADLTHHTQMFRFVQKLQKNVPINADDIH